MNLNKRLYKEIQFKSFASFWQFHNPGLVNEQVTITAGECEPPRRSTGQSDKVTTIEDTATNGITNEAFPTCHYTEVKIHVVPEADEPRTK